VLKRLKEKDHRRWRLLIVLTGYTCDNHDTYSKCSRCSYPTCTLALVLARSMTWVTVTILANSIPKVLLDIFQHLLRLYKLSCVFA
jgi:hypothetical protein